MSNNNLAIIRAFLKAIETNGDATAFFAGDAVHVQMPNAIYPKGARMDVATMKANAEKGKALLTRQSYEVTSGIEVGDVVVVEVKWTGTLAIPLRGLQPGDEMIAHCAMFFEMERGRIKAQRNYDCYEPLPPPG